MSVSEAELREGIRRLGLSDRPVCAHCSMRSFGHVEGGARTLASAFLDEGSTLLVPSFSWIFSSDPPAVGRPTRNGTDYDFPARTPLGVPYSRGSTAVDPDMGALSAAVVLGPGRERGDHPICSFTAIGPLASDLVDSQRPDAVWAPLEALVRLEGSVVLMGVDLTRLTLIHLAEAQAGRRPFVRWAHCGGVTAHPVNVGGCSDGFGKLDPPLNERLGARGESELSRISVEYDFDETAAVQSCVTSLAAAVSEGSDDRAARSDYVARALSDVDWNDFPSLEDLATMVEAGGSGERATAKRILGHLGEPGQYEDYSLLVEQTFSDALRFKKIEIRYDEKPLVHASFGQRCSAALIILLMLGNMPIVIDEPEAHLDSALIADLLVSLIKDRKGDRQIIFATHNANFVVNGDSELIHVLSLDGSDPTVVTSVSLEDREHRSEVLRLEGGAKAFRQREERYGFRDRFAPPAE